MDIEKLCVIIRLPDDVLCRELHGILWVNSKWFSSVTDFADCVRARYREKAVAQC